MNNLREAARALLDLLAQNPIDLRATLIAEGNLRAALSDDRVSVPREPLSVFDKGPWIWKETGESFTGAQLDEAAFVKYRDAMLAATEKGPKNG